MRRQILSEKGDRRLLNPSVHGAGGAAEIASPGNTRGSDQPLGFGIKLALPLGHLGQASVADGTGLLAGTAMGAEANLRGIVCLKNGIGQDLPKDDLGAVGFVDELKLIPDDTETRLGGGTRLANGRVIGKALKMTSGKGLLQLFLKVLIQTAEIEMIVPRYGIERYGSLGIVPRVIRDGKYDNAHRCPIGTGARQQLGIDHLTFRKGDDPKGVDGFFG